MEMENRPISGRVQGIQADMRVAPRTDAIRIAFQEHGSRTCMQLGAGGTAGEHYCVSVSNAAGTAIWICYSSGSNRPNAVAQACRRSFPCALLSLFKSRRRLRPITYLFLMMQWFKKTKAKKRGNALTRQPHMLHQKWLSCCQFTIFVI